VKAKPLATKRRTVRQGRADVAKKSAVKNVLAVDVGGTSVKILTTGQKQHRSFPSGPTLGPVPICPPLGSLTFHFNVPSGLTAYTVFSEPK